MPLVRKRRAEAGANPSPPPTRRRSSSPSEASSVDEDHEETTGPDGDTHIGSGSHGQMVKNLVRHALASEYTRQPIRRSDITAKVLGLNCGRQRFRMVFNDAQQQLHKVLGMELTELPQKEKVTISQKRAAQRSQGASSSTKSYILTSTLPAAFRISQILIPARIPSTATEASYTGFYTFVISVISLSPRGAIPEARLERHLKRMNADDYVLNGEKTEKVLKRMEREGYIVKVRERDGGGEESVDYIIGPRGKAEVGERGVADMVRKVYGKKDVEADELEKKLVRSLGDVVIVQKNRRVAVEEDETGNGGFEENKNGDANEHSAMSRARPIPGRRKKRSRDEEEAEEDDAEDENGEEQENSDDDDDGDDDDGDE